MPANPLFHPPKREARCAPSRFGRPSIAKAIKLWQLNGVGNGGKDIEYQ